MLKVLVVENGAGFGGALTSLESLLSALPRDRCEVHVLIGYPQDCVRPGGAVRGVAVLERERRYGSNAPLQKRLAGIFGGRAGNAAFVVDHLTTGRRFASAVARLVRERGVDVVHGNNGVLVNDAVIFGARRAGRPCVIHSRGTEYPSRVAAWLARKVDHFLPVSGYVGDTVRAFGVPEERITVVPEGLDATAFAAGADGAAVRAELDLAPGTPVVGMVGCLVAWKGHSVFLDACARTLARRGAVALIAGGAPGGDPGAVDRLRARTAELGVADRVRFLGHRSDVPSVMAACDVVVHASTEPEPFGRVILEAMALGRPVIAARAGGPGEFVREGVDGLLTPPGDAAALAEALDRLLADADLRARLGTGGREGVARYSIERHVELVLGVWERLAG